MAQRFSKPFYNSKQWKVCREFILKRDKYLCTKCGNPAEEVHHVVRLTPENIKDAEIAVNETNLTSLCKNCHFKEHEDAKIKGTRLKNKKDFGDVVEGFEFDENGFVVQSPLVKK